MELLHWSSHFKESLFISSYAFGLWERLWISFQICCGDILQDLQVPPLCFSESFPWGVIAVPAEVVGKLIFTLHGWKGGRKAPFVYIWVSGADCEPLAGRGDVTGSGEPANGSSPPISGDGCSVGNYEHSVGALISAGSTASLRAGPACWTAGLLLQTSLALPAQF